MEHIRHFLCLFLLGTWAARAERGRHAELPTTPAPSGTLDLAGLHTPSADVPVGCRELRSKRYISDGYCTAIRPVSEVVCSGHCLPLDRLPWYAEVVKVWSRTKVLEYRCVEDAVRRKRVRLHCDDGSVRSYVIRVVKSCKCKRITSKHNQTQRRPQDNADAAGAPAAAPPAAAKSKSAEDM